MRHSAALLAVAGALVCPLVARAANVQLTIAAAPGVTVVGVAPGGVRVYAVYVRHAVLLRGSVRDDAGKAPPAGTRVRLGTQPRAGIAPTSLATVSTDAAGGFQLRTTPTRSHFYLAHVDAAAAAGIAAAVDAIPVRLGVAPRLRLTSPATQQGQPYRIVGVVELARARTTGRVCLLRVVRGGLKGLGCSSIDRHRRFHFAVIHLRAGIYRYRIVFMPRDPLVYVRSTTRLTVRVATGG